MYWLLLYIIAISRTLLGSANEILNGIKISPLLGVQSGQSYSRTELATHPYVVVQMSYTFSPTVVCSRRPKQLPSHCGFTQVTYDLLQYSTIFMQRYGEFMITTSL